MEILNHAELQFDSQSVNEGFARMGISAFFAALNPTVEELTDLKTAASEAVTNAIVHGYRHKRGMVKVTLKIIAPATAYIRIKDNGCGIADIEKAMEPLYTTAPEEERAGLGFAVMQSFMDSVQVSSKPGKGTTVTMKRAIYARHRHDPLPR